MTTVRVNRDPPGARVTFPFDGDVVELIKTLPSGARRWDPVRKSWWVGPLEVDALITILETGGHRIVGDWTRARQESAPPPRRPRDTAQGWADALFVAVGTSRTEPVYRALTKVLHPDVATGDTDLCQQLNAARDRRAVRR